MIEREIERDRERCYEIYIFFLIGKTFSKALNLSFPFHKICEVNSCRMELISQVNFLIGDENIDFFP